MHLVERLKWGKTQTLTLALLFRGLAGKLGEVGVHPPAEPTSGPVFRPSLAKGDGILPLAVCFPMTAPALLLLLVERPNPFASPGGPNTPIFGREGRSGESVESFN